MTVALARSAVAACVCWASLALYVSASSHPAPGDWWEVIALDANGGEHVAGEGSSCALAEVRMVLPADASQWACVRVR